MPARAALHYSSLAELAAALRGGAISAGEVAEHFLQRIETLEPRLHAFAHVRWEGARADAQAADERRARGLPLGSLHGIPIAIKDLCAMAGTPTRAGGFFSTRFDPNVTASAVRALQGEGAIIVGKTQLTEGAWGAHHPDIPAPVNPWAPHRWSGSSSSGSGVAVAAGLAAGAIGTDTAGSIRFPSACNGLVGLKPTWGRVSRYGVFPLSETFDHVGPMTRTVLDAALMFSAMAGPDRLDPTALDREPEDWVSAAQGGSLAGVKIGFDRSFALNVDEATAAAMTGAIDTLRKAGADIVDAELPPLEDILDRAVAAAFVEAAIAHAPTYPLEKDKYSLAYAGLLDIGRRTPAVDYAQVAIWRREFAGRLAHMFTSVDMLAIPVLPAVPLTAAVMKSLEGVPPTASGGFLRFTLPFNLAGAPSLTLPMGRLNDDTPLGFQLIGPLYGERALLSAGAAYERAAGLSDQHPAL